MSASWIGKLAFDPDQVSVGQLIAAVNRAGFRAALKQAKPAK